MRTAQLCRFLQEIVCCLCNSISTRVHTFRSSMDTVQSCTASGIEGSWTTGLVEFRGWTIRLYLHTFKCKGRHSTSKRQFSFSLSSSRTPLLPPSRCSFQLPLKQIFNALLSNCLKSYTKTVEGVKRNVAKGRRSPWVRGDCKIRSVVNETGKEQEVLCRTKHIRKMLRNEGPC